MFWSGRSQRPRVNANPFKISLPPTECELASVGIPTKEQNMSKGKVPSIIRVMDTEGEFCGNVRLDVAERLAGEGKVDIHYNGRRSFVQVLVAVVDFDHAHMDRPCYHHHETHAGHTLVVIKRPSVTRSYGEKWDKHLTFGELRQGRLISAETIRIREAARRARAKAA